MNNKFKIGQRVVVTDNGKTYSTYDQMAGCMGLKKWKSGNDLPNGSTAVIVNVKPHLSWSGTIVYGIEDENGKQTIIGEYGIELVKQLPKQWYVQCDFNPNETPELLEWRKGVTRHGNWHTSGTISETGFWRADGIGTELSYDDFLKLVYRPWKQSQTTTKHPEYWYIQCTPENFEELQAYYSKTDHGHWNLRNYHILLSKHPNDDSSYWSSSESYFNQDHPEYVKITLEQFREITKNINTNTMKQLDPKTEIAISRTTLNEYYEAATTSQREYLEEHFTLGGKTTVKGIQGLYNIACDKWKPIIKKNHPNCFVEEPTFNFKPLDKGHSTIFTQEEAIECGFRNNNFIQIADGILNGKYKNKGIYFSEQYEWEVIKIDGGGVVVVPIKKA